ncbi:MAG: chorismate mutase [Blastocatellia bacterium]
MRLEECREHIDHIDTKILALLNRRAEIAKEIGTLKLRSGLPIVDPEREANILRSICRDNPGDLSDEAAARIYQQILLESRQIQLGISTEISRNGEAVK